MALGAQPTLADRAARIREKLVEKTNEVDAKIQKSPSGTEIREATNGALVAASTGNYAQSERMFRAAYDEQKLVPGEDMGKMPWKIKNNDIKDANSIDFATECLGPLITGYSAKFSPAYQKYIRDHAQAALVALANHHIAVTYSNIYTMNFSNQILIGEALHDDAAAARGYKNLDTWIDYTNNAGLHEYDSPTYNSVVLSALMMIYQYSTNAHAKSQAAAGLRYVWTDLAANYFPADKMIAGAHSRDYNFLYGTGGIDIYYFWQAFQDDFNGGAPLERAFLYEATKPGGYYSNIKPFPADIPRFITQRFGDRPQDYRITFITPDFAIGTANGNYDPQDKLFAVDFAQKGSGSKKLPSVFFGITSTGLPYGLDKKKDSGGHVKPHHMRTNLGAIQNLGLALMVAEANPDNDAGHSTYFIDLVFPADGQFTLDGKPASATSTQDRKLERGQTIGLHIGNACLAVRPIVPEGAAFDVHMVSNSDSQEQGTFLLRAAVPTHGPQQVGYLANIVRCTEKGNPAETDLKSADIKASTTGHTWTVDASVKSGANAAALALHYDTSKFESTGYRVNGKDFTTPALNIKLMRTMAAAAPQ